MNLTLKFGEDDFDKITVIIKSNNTKKAREIKVNYSEIMEDDEWDEFIDIYRIAEKMDGAGIIALDTAGRIANINEGRRRTGASELFQD